MRSYNPSPVAMNPNTLALAIYLGDAPESVKVAAIAHAYAPMASFIASLIGEAEGAETVPASTSYRASVRKAA